MCSRDVRSLKLLDLPRRMDCSSLEERIQQLKIDKTLLYFLENVSEEDWTVNEVTEKLQSSDERSNWKMAFREGVDLDERTFKENRYREDENIPFKARYDLTYLTPSRCQLRCKVCRDGK